MMNPRVTPGLYLAVRVVITNTVIAVSTAGTGYI